jgi:hypothetical protein
MATSETMRKKQLKASNGKKVSPQPEDISASYNKFKKFEESNTRE